MTSLVPSNVKDNVCICCTSQSDVSVKFCSCKHTGFLLNYIKSEIEFKNMYLCNICHNMLKKIEVFKQQVEDSIALLLNQVPILKINKLHDLQRSPVKIDEVTEDGRQIEIEIKVEPEYMEVEPDVKFEHDSSGNDSEPAVELKKLKKEKKKKVNTDPSIPRCAVPSYAQLEMLLESLEQNIWLATGYARTSHARDRTRKAWQEIAVKLKNSDGTGCNKNWQQWAKYWKDKKSAVKKKASQVRMARRQIGGGSLEEGLHLSAIEEKIVHIMGGERVSGDGEPEIELIHPSAIEPGPSFNMTPGAPEDICEPSDAVVVSIQDIAEEANATQMSESILQDVQPSCNIPKDQPNTEQVFETRSPPAVTHTPSIASSLHNNKTERQRKYRKQNRDKLKQREADRRYEGKIGVVMLTEEEVRVERETSAKNEGYLKLPYKCEDCIVGFDHEVSLVSHIEKKHRKMENGLECNVCKTILNSKGPYTAHKKTHTRRVECLICHKRYNRMQSAIQHYDEQHAAPGATLQQGYSCTECDYKTTSNRAYRYHMDKHKKKHICSICANIFANSQGLKTHMYTVHNQSPRVYKCEPCNKSYRSRTGFEAHERTAHGTADTRAFCVQCNTHYSTPQGLRNHLNTSSRHVSETDKRFICDECGAKFATKSALTVHINWEHIKSNAHRCTTCSKVFKSYSALNRHVNYVHNKMQAPRNKICDYCGRAFTTQQKLQNHIRTHTGERPLHCKHCPATFAHSAALYNHNRLLHTAK